MPAVPEGAVAAVVLGEAPVVQEAAARRELREERLGAVATNTLPLARVCTLPSLCAEVVVER